MDPAVSSVDGSLSEASVNTFLVGREYGTPGEIASFGTVLYVATSGGSIEALNVNADGSLTSVVGSPFTAGSLPLSVAFSPSGGYLATANAGSTNVSVFAVNQSTGALTQVTGSPFLLGTTTDQVGPGAPAVVDPFGKFFYIGNSANLSALSIDASSGALSPVPGSPFSIVSTKLGMDPLGRFLYTIDSDTDAVSSSSINTSTGAPTILPGFAPVTSIPLGLDPSGKFFYGVTTANPPFSISAFAIDQTTGLLTPVAGSPFPLAGTILPQGIIVTRKAQ